MSKTGVFTFGMLLVVAGYDVFVILRDGTASSVSQWIADTTHASPLQSFTCGVLAAHFFGWMMFPKKDKT